MSAAPLGLSAADRAEVEAIVCRAGTSFYRGMRVLPPDRRYAMYGVYAFCRLVDDIADDDDATFEAKAPRLDAWRRRVDDLFAGEADGPVTRALLAAVRTFGLRRQDFLDVIDGMAMDAGVPIVAPTLAELDLYCDRVAAAVGRLSVRAFGDSSPAADEVAYNLGRALQLTNILRDLHEDAVRGRIYLPQEWLHDAGISPNPETLLSESRLPEVCERVAALAHEHFDRAHTAMQSCDRRAMKPARLMGATYAAILARLESRGWEDNEERVGLPAWQKLWLALRYGVV
ncbi:MAG TPA: presqualene diphosphate synthase HpnD [Acidisphaera sp.]|nr:presqualene diphosphate synthase HpnD [Acidisphaera sp.]